MKKHLWLILSIITVVAVVAYWRTRPAAPVETTNEEHVPIAQPAQPAPVVPNAGGMPAARVPEPGANTAPVPNTVPPPSVESPTANTDNFVPPPPPPPPPPPQSYPDPGADNTFPPPPPPAYDPPPVYDEDGLVQPQVPPPPPPPPLEEE